MKCPECGSETKLVRTPLSRICTNNSCQFQAEPGEPGACDHLANGEPEAILAGGIREEAHWECVACGEELDYEEYKLPNPIEEWANKDADRADQLREWYA